ncbi:hypothetical protein [Streptomyces globisporus]|uniref:phage baseplate protein n=1 Tax=Streptomyces globisporus TaxID=1908 RepID=UPI0004C657A2|nr:hypothetical protein [Streptomyces globisporus]
MITLASAVPPPVLLNAAQLAYSGSVAQSFFWDLAGRHWYVCQRNVTDQDQQRILVTRLTADGDVVDSMHVERAGHGANIGVENTGGSVFLWTDALPKGHWASAVARIPYVPGGSVDASDTTLPASAVTFHAPRPSGSVYRVSATIDPMRRELVYRWQSNDVSSDKAVGGIDRYALDAVVAGTYTPLATRPFSASGRSLQGYTSLGDHIYTLYGLPNAESRVTCTRWDTGEVVQDEPFTAFPAVVGREPEGLCVYEIAGAPPTLAFGVVSGADGARRFNAGRFPHPETNPWVPLPYDTAVLAPNGASYAPQYRIAGDQVHLHFSLDRVDKGAWVSGAKLFQLPVPARPNRTQRLVGVLSGAFVTGQPLTVRLEVTADGWVTLFDDRGFKGWIGADVSFWTC